MLDSMVVQQLTLPWDPVELLLLLKMILLASVYMYWDSLARDLTMYRYSSEARPILRTDINFSALARPMS